MGLGGLPFYSDVHVDMHWVPWGILLHAVTDVYMGNSG